MLFAERRRVVAQMGRNSTSSPPRVGRLAPLAAIGAIVGGTAAAAMFLKKSARHGSVTDKSQSLATYLKDHLSGADLAIQVVRRLASSQPHGEDGALFAYLLEELAEDRDVVRALLLRLGASERSLKRAAGRASGSLLSVAAGGAPGDLSLFRTLEALAIAVQGKRCLWRSLQILSGAPELTQGFSFAELEAKALRQWEAIEQRRRRLALTTFPGFHTHHIQV